MHDTFNLHGISVEYYIPAKCQGIRTFLPVDSIDTCAAIGEPVTGLHKGFSRPVGESHGQMGNLTAKSFVCRKNLTAEFGNLTARW